MLQSQEENRARTSSAACGGGAVHLTAYLPHLDHRPGLQEQATDG